MGEGINLDTISLKFTASAGNVSKTFDALERRLTSLNNVTDKLNTLQYVLFQYINQANSLKALISSTTSSSNLAATLARAATATSVRMTVTVVVVLPVMLVYPFFQRFFTKGIMIGAVKG